MNEMVAARVKEAPPATLARDGPGLFQDIPAIIWTAFLGGWGTFFLLLLFFFAVDGPSAFMVTVVLLFGLMAFGLPIILARQCHDPDHVCSDIVQTRTGPLSLGAAAVQIALIPIAVVIGLLGFIVLAK